MRKIIWIIIIICYVGAVEGTTIFDDGEVHDVDYVVQGTIDVQDDSFSGDFTTVNFLPNGMLDWDFHAWDNSQINISGGIMTKTFYAFDNSRITFSDGTIGAVCACDNSFVDISGGSITDNLRADDNAQIICSGGSIGNEILAGDLSGGIVYNSTITFFGSNFAIDGEIVSYGQYFYKDYQNGRLSGKLANGDIIDNNFHIVDGASIILIPEPTTLLLLSLGGLLLRKKH